MKKQKEKQQKKQHDLNRGKENKCFYPSEKEAKEAILDIGQRMYVRNFVAANDGVVTKAGYNGAYGNMVIIDHGGGISTLYAHGSEILVTVGQTVKKGDVILKVGSTGYSTGAHAHFEVRVNGQVVNPLPYITTNTKVEENNNTED